MNTPSPEQTDALLTFLEEHPDLALARKRNAMGRIESRELWRRLANELNALDGCTKRVEQWQRVWADKKYLAKKTAAGAQNGKVEGQLTAQEVRILLLLEGHNQLIPNEESSEDHGEPHEEQPEDQEDWRPPQEPEVHVPSVGDEQSSDPIEVKSQPPSSPEHDSASEAESDDSEPPAKEEIPVQRRVSSSTPRSENRRRRLESSGPFLRRFFRLEERRLASDAQRNQELALIREALQEITRVLRTSLQGM